MYAIYDHSSQVEANTFTKFVHEFVPGLWVPAATDSDYACDMVRVDHTNHHMSIESNTRDKQECFVLIDLPPRNTRFLSFPA